MAVTAKVVSALSSKFALATGIGTISIANVGTEIDAATLAPDAVADGTKWQSVFATLANSFTVTMADPTKTSISTDQDGVIASSKTAGDFTIAFTVPEVSREQMAFFFNETSYDNTDAGFEIVEVGTALKTIEKAVRVDLSNGDIIVFSKVELNGALTKTGEDLFSISVTGNVLAYNNKEVVFGYKK